MKCKYCGKSTGFFSRAHKDCEEKHQQGEAELLALLRAYFVGNDNIADVIRKIGAVQSNNYLNKEDVEDCCRQGIKHFTDMIRLPITKEHLQKIDTFLHNINISQTALNKNGELDKLGTRLYQGVLMSYFVEREPMQKVEKRTQMIAGLLPLTTSMKEDAGLHVLNKAAQKFLSNGLISGSEQAQLDEFTNSLRLPVNNLPVQYRGSDIEKIQQAGILSQLQNGSMPNFRPINLPIMLSQGEGVIWTYENVTMLQEKITREWVGRHNGMTFRVVKGVYYRTGGTKGRPVEKSTMETVGVGTLILTNKNICFHSTTRSIKIPYKKLAGMTPYSDGIELHQEGAKAQRQVFQGFDSWFMMNLLSYIQI